MNKRKGTLDFQRSGPVSKIFNKRSNKQRKKGNGVLADHVDSTYVSPEYQSIKGLSKEEMILAMHEVKLGYTWEICSITPKTDHAKRQDYEALMKDREYRDSSFGF